MKVSTRPSAEIEKEFKTAPSRKVGQWKSLIAQVVESHKPVEVLEVTYGQIAALRRTAKDKAVEVRSFDKGTRAIIMPKIKGKTEQ